MIVISGSLILIDMKLYKLVVSDDSLIRKSIWVVAINKKCAASKGWMMGYIVHEVL